MSHPDKLIPSDILKEKVRKLSTLSETLSNLKNEVKELKAEILKDIIECNMQKVKFDFEDKYIKYKKSNDRGAITQTLLKSVLPTLELNISTDTIIAAILDARTSNTRETVDVIFK